MATIIELVRSAGGARKPQYQEVCDRTQGKQGHDTIEGHAVTFYLVMADRGSKTVVGHALKIDKVFVAQDKVVTGGPFETMTALLNAWQAQDSKAPKA